MSKIIVAGAGTGGLAVASELAKQGLDVVIYEQDEEVALGYDWEDRFSIPLLFDLVGKPVSYATLRQRADSTFFNASQTTAIVAKFAKDKPQYMMKRKEIYAYLLAYAKECGVKIEYGIRITAPLIKEDKIIGIQTESGNIEGSLVIDSLGINSPLRRKLPLEFNIEREYERGEAFYAYRAYYNRIAGIAKTDAPFETYLCHNGEAGISWLATEDDFIDVLIGRIDPLTEEKIEEVLADFRAKRPQLGTVIVSGGRRGIIPVRRPLAIMVADGYAAIGDSAFMTLPMNGMGIDLSIKAGKLLAKTIMASNGNYDIKNLWRYNYSFISEYGGTLASNEILKNTLLNLTGKEIDFLFDCRIIMASDLSGGGANTNLGVLIGKLIRGMRQPKTFFKVLNAIAKGGKAKKIYNAIPVMYDRNAVTAWISKLKNTVLKVN